MDGAIVMPPIDRKTPRAREEWEALEDSGKCAECGQPKPCGPPCRRFWFDYGFRIGYHDGANNMPRHDGAFTTEMCERDEYSPD